MDPVPRAHGEFQVRRVSVCATVGWPWRTGYYEYIRSVNENFRSNRVQGSAADGWLSAILPHRSPKLEIDKQGSGETRFSLGNPEPWFFRRIKSVHCPFPYRRRESLSSRWRGRCSSRYPGLPVRSM